MLSTFQISIGSMLARGHRRIIRKRKESTLKILRSFVLEIIGSLIYIERCNDVVTDEGPLLYISLIRFD